jgi:hypothetical protein
VLADSSIGDRHKRVLLDIYESFRAEHAAARTDTASGRTPAAPAKRTPAKKTAKKQTTKRTSAAPRTRSASQRRKSA